jgi:hypothetical protein
MNERRVLVLNSHEAWVSQLAYVPRQFDIAVGLSGRSQAGWDERMRPVPANARLIDLRDALSSKEPYSAAIGHSITDLLELKHLDIPKLLVIHTTIEGRLKEASSDLSARLLSDETKKYIKLIKAHAICVSRLKQASWNMSGDLVGFAVNVNDYPLAHQEVAHGLRISNHFNKRRAILLADFHDSAFGDLPVEFVGENLDMPGVTPANDWADLKQRIARSRFYIHTADPRLEDGYNMATVEAMASGLPVLGNCHPSSVVHQGVTGFTSDDPRELRSFAELLLADRTLSLKMGAAAREAARDMFSPATFELGMMRALACAKAKFYERPHPNKKQSPAKKKRK